MRKKLFTLLVATLSVMKIGCSEKETEMQEVDKEVIEETVNTVGNQESPEEVTEEVTEETDEVATEEKPAVEEVTEEEVTETVPTEYTYADMDSTMYVQKTVNVRDLPSTNGAKLGSLSINDEIHVTGQCNETSWYRFDFNGKVAYVSNSYVSTEKVAVAETPAKEEVSSGAIGKNKAIEMISKCCTPPDTLTGRYIKISSSRYIFEVTAGMWVDTHMGYYTSTHFGGTMQKVPCIEYDKYPDGFYYAPRDEPGYNPNWTPDGTILYDASIAF